jgi:hypothetical protein
MGRWCKYGVVWEAFLTTGDSTTYGESPDLAGFASDNAGGDRCCVHQTVATTETGNC